MNGRSIVHNTSYSQALLNLEYDKVLISPLEQYITVLFSHLGYDRFQHFYNITVVIDVINIAVILGFNEAEGIR